MTVFDTEISFISIWFVPVALSQCFALVCCWTTSASNQCYVQHVQKEWREFQKQKVRTTVSVTLVLVSSAKPVGNEKEKNRPWKTVSRRTIRSARRFNFHASCCSKTKRKEKHIPPGPSGRCSGRFGSLPFFNGDICCPSWIGSPPLRPFVYFRVCFPFLWLWLRFLTRNRRGRKKKMGGLTELSDYQRWLPAQRTTLYAAARVERGSVGLGLRWCGRLKTMGAGTHQQQIVWQIGFIRDVTATNIIGCQTILQLADYQFVLVLKPKLLRDSFLGFPSAAGHNIHRILIDYDGITPSRHLFFIFVFAYFIFFRRRMIERKDRCYWNGSSSSPLDRSQQVGVEFASLVRWKDGQTKKRKRRQRSGGGQTGMCFFDWNDYERSKSRPTHQVVRWEVVSAGQHRWDKSRTRGKEKGKK